MRSDYALYGVAIILFVITAIFVTYRFEYYELSAVTTTVFGLLFLGLGYAQRPKARAATIESPPPPPVSTATEIVQEAKPETVVEVAPPKIELTTVKGIKEKRAAQLKALGIHTVEDLAKASANDLGAKLKISPKITEKWIASAKELLEKS
ncbi:MAG: hypothetical protein QHH18_05530 [Candidatus Bathyarchaeota archaeon]|jgi:predicted flap endonuclease-1-like 5' DNA nuclease|nr:hypothetical protein [Candidatus Bathyarchaeota archaeon A05DMB-5]MDH7558050.1 hypothetical protein [Candidatus Bathyarchaeota archaeon]